MLSADNVRFVLDQLAYLNLYNVSSLTRQWVVRYIIPIPSQPVFALTP
jgi:hypothetical protein